MRQKIADQLTYFGVKLDPDKNNVRGVEQEISQTGAPVDVWVVPTNEELMIARDVARLTK